MLVGALSSDGVSMNRRSHWQRVYTGKASTDVSWFQPGPIVSTELLNTAGLQPHTWYSTSEAEIPASWTICWIAPSLYQRARHLRGTLARAQQRLGPRQAQVRWIEADVTGEWTVPRVDIWHDRAVFHFLTEPRIASDIASACFRDAAWRIGRHRDVRPARSADVQRAADGPILSGAAGRGTGGCVSTARNCSRGSPDAVRHDAGILVLPVHARMVTLFFEGLRPSNSPTRSLAGAPRSPLRSRGSLATLVRRSGAAPIWIPEICRSPRFWSSMMSRRIFRSFGDSCRTRATW